MTIRYSPGGFLSSYPLRAQGHSHSEEDSEKVAVWAALQSCIYRKELGKLLMKQQAFRKYM